MPYKEQNKKGIGLKYAINGILLGYKEKNFIIHNLVSICVIIFGIILNISLIEWCIIIICIGVVLTAELINTTIENIVNELSPQQSIFAKNTKDIAAGAVLIAAIAAAIIGSIIYIPKLYMIFL
ncbi:MAG: diacylglycerol kinase family protein [Bacteroidota bacterium]